MSRTSSVATTAHGGEAKRRAHRYAGTPARLIIATFIAFANSKLVCTVLANQPGAISSG